MARHLVLSREEMDKKNAAEKAAKDKAEAEEQAKSKAEDERLEKEKKAIEAKEAKAAEEKKKKEAELKRIEDEKAKKKAAEAKKKAEAEKKKKEEEAKKNKENTAATKIQQRGRVVNAKKAAIQKRKDAHLRRIQEMQSGLDMLDRAIDIRLVQLILDHHLHHSSSTRRPNATPFRAQPLCSTSRISLTLKSGPFLALV
jgi:outer membrane biosynthesis protein TonB